MDAQRSRRTKDEARKAWYAYYRQVRFARWFGFIEDDADLSLLFRNSTVPDDTRVHGPLGNAAGATDWREPALLV
jgi:hypothetical protein